MRAPRPASGGPPQARCFKLQGGAALAGWVPSRAPPGRPQQQPAPLSLTTLATEVANRSKLVAAAASSRSSPSLAPAAAGGQ